jgi:phytoene synthase
MLGQVRLQWWREAIDEAYGGVLRPHEVMQALGPCIAEHQLSRCYFDRLLDAREADLDDRPLPTMAALQDYAEATSSTLGWLALEILGASGDAARTAVGHVGAAWALSGLLRALPLHLKAKRIYLPRDLTLRHGLDPQALVAPPAAQAGARPLCNVVAEIADTARLHLSAARALRPEVEAAALPMLLPAVISRHHLRRLARAGHDPFSRSLPQPVALSR